MEGESLRSCRLDAPGGPPRQPLIIAHVPSRDRGTNSGATALSTAGKNRESDAMSAITAMMLMMGATPLHATPIDFDLRDSAGPEAHAPLTAAVAPPRRSRYLPPRLHEVAEDEPPAKLRWRGRKIKLRVPVGPGG
jgi:hypothetical protein